MNKRIIRHPLTKRITRRTDIGVLRPSIALDRPFDIFISTEYGISVHVQLTEAEYAEFLSRCIHIQQNFLCSFTMAVHNTYEVRADDDL